MHQHAADTEYFGGIKQAQLGIRDQRPTNTAALIGPVDSQSTNYRDRDRIWHVSLTPAWSFRCPHRAGGKSVGGDDTISVADYNSTRRTARVVGSRSSAQPIIQF